MKFFKKKSVPSGSAPDESTDPADDLRPAKVKPGELVTVRNEFYQDGYRKNLAIILFLTVALIISALLNVYQVVRAQSVEREYFSVSATGQLTPLVPLNAKFLSNEQLLAWATKAAVTSFTFDAGNYRERFNEISEYYTPYGFDQYKAAMQASGQIDQVVAESLIVTAVPLAVPVIVADGQLKTGEAVWRVRLPIQISYRTAGKSSSVSRLITMVIMRRSLSESPFGVGVTQFISRPISSSELTQ